MENRLWGVTEVAEYLGVTKARARNYMREKNCPTLDKRKNAQMKVVSSTFIEWVEGGMQ